MQETRERIDRKFSSDVTRTAWKTNDTTLSAQETKKKLRGYAEGGYRETQTAR
jgi:hypothetical protein